MNDRTFKRMCRAMVKATRLTFDDYRRKHPQEQFYAFALYADEDGDGLNPAAHTEEAYQVYLARNTAFSKTELGLLRYCPNEWLGDYTGSTRQKEWLTVCDLIDPLLGDETIEWEQGSARIFDGMIKTLAELDEMGYFGKGAAREAITLMVWITDSPLDKALWAPSVKILNPSKVYKRFLKEIPRSYRA